jgi:hypothetical protein
MPVPELAGAGLQYSRISAIDATWTAYRLGVAWLPPPPNAPKLSAFEQILFQRSANGRPTSKQRVEILISKTRSHDGGTLYRDDSGAACDRRSARQLGTSGADFVRRTQVKKVISKMTYHWGRVT